MAIRRCEVAGRSARLSCWRIVGVKEAPQPPTLDDPLQNMDELTSTALARGIAKMLRQWTVLGRREEVLILFHGYNDPRSFRLGGCGSELSSSVAVAESAAHRSHDQSLSARSAEVAVQNLDGMCGRGPANRRSRSPLFQAASPRCLQDERHPAGTRGGAHLLHPQTTVGFVDVLFDGGWNSREHQSTVMADASHERRCHLDEWSGEHVGQDKRPCAAHGCQARHVANFRRSLIALIRAFSAATRSASVSMSTCDCSRHSPHQRSEREHASAPLFPRRARRRAERSPSGFIECFETECGCWMQARAERAGINQPEEHPALLRGEPEQSECVRRESGEG